MSTQEELFNKCKFLELCELLDRAIYGEYCPLCGKKRQGTQLCKLCRNISPKRKTAKYDEITVRVKIRKD